MSEATYQILYREQIGAGDNEEASQDNGIVVTLSHWEKASGDWRVRSHYMLERRVMINRHFIVDDIVTQIDSHSESKHAKMIRKAVEMVDYLIEQNPQVVEHE